MLPGVHEVDEIDFAPSTLGSIRQAGKPSQDMTREQRAAALLALNRMAAAARGEMPCDARHDVPHGFSRIP